jgi:hypothetical protein
VSALCRVLSADGTNATINVLLLAMSMTWHLIHSRTADACRTKWDLRAS